MLSNKRIMRKTKKIIRVLLLCLIILSIGMRFYKIDVFSVDSDELLHMTRALKFHQQGFKAGREFVSPHVPLGAWTLGIPSKFIKADYKPLKLIGGNMFIWSYLAYDALSKNYIPMRMVAALCGSLTILFIFLIAKKIFGTDAGLWAACISALSSDMFGASRAGMLGGFMLFYTSGTIYFFIKYQTERWFRKYLFLLANMIFLIFALMSRLYQPLFLIPILIIIQFLLNRGLPSLQKNITFVVGVLICVYISFNIIFPPSFIMTSEMNLNSSLFGAGLLDLLIIFITRNSYLFLFSEILLIIVGIDFLTKKEEGKRRFTMKKLKEYFHRGELSLILLVYFIITFIPLMFVKSEFLYARYISFLFIPIFVLGGYAVSRMIRKKGVMILVLLLLFVNTFFLVYNFPNGIFFYSNFGLYSTFGHQSSGMLGGANEYTNDILDYLNGSYLVSNYADVLIKYKYDKDSIPIPNEERCNQEYFAKLKEKNGKVLYYESSGRTINDDPYICPLLRAMGLHEEKAFEEFKIYFVS